MQHILVTGVAGFIGFHTARRLLEEGHAITGMDDLNDYYDVSLKEARLSRLEKEDHFRFEKADLADRSATQGLFEENTFDRVVHLAAQVGVRYSIDHPEQYVDSNLVGFANVLEGCRHVGVGSG